MINPKDVDLPFGIGNLVDKPIRTPAARPQTFQFAPERVSDTARILKKGPKHEFDDGGCGLLWQTAQHPIGRRCNDQIPATAITSQGTSVEAAPPKAPCRVRYLRVPS